MGCSSQKSTNALQPHMNQYDKRNNSLQNQKGNPQQNMNSQSQYNKNGNDPYQQNSNAQKNQSIQQNNLQNKNAQNHAVNTQKSNLNAQNQYAPQQNQGYHQNNYQKEVQQPVHKYKLYWSIQSAPSRALKSFMDVAKTSGLKFEDFNLDLTKNEQKSPKILVLNPKGTIPFLVFNSDVLTETSATLRFVASMVDSLKKYYPYDPLQRHKVDAALDYCGSTLRPYINKTLQICFKALNTTGQLETFEKKAISDNRNKIKEQYMKLEEMLQQNGEFLAGQSPTIADFLIFFEIQQSELVFDEINNYPKLKYWKNFCLQLPGIKDVASLWKQKVYTVFIKRFEDMLSGRIDYNSQTKSFKNQNNSSMKEPKNNNHQQNQVNEDVLRCDKNHILKYTKFHPNNYASYTCNHCRKTWPNYDKGANCCSICQYDLCHICSDLKTKQNQQYNDLEKKIASKQTMKFQDYRINSIIGQVYVQKNKLGLASYHFDEPINLEQQEDEMGGCYISFENAPSDWTLQDGQRPPLKKYFINPKFNKQQKTFTGKIDWEQNPFEGLSKQEYIIKFSFDFKNIESGTIMNFDIFGTYKSTSKYGEIGFIYQVLPIQMKQDDHKFSRNHDDMDEFDLFKNSSSKSPNRNHHLVNKGDSDFERDQSQSRENYSAQYSKNTHSKSTTKDSSEEIFGGNQNPHQKSMNKNKYDLPAIDEEEQFKLAIEQSMKESKTQNHKKSFKAPHNQFDEYEDALGNSYGNKKGLNDSFAKSGKKNLY